MRLVDGRLNRGRADLNALYRRLAAADGLGMAGACAALLFLADAEAARPAKEAAADAAAAAEAQAKVDAEVATKVEAVFREADKNKSGTLAGSELKTVFGMLGIDGGKKHVADALAKYDTDGTKSLDLGEFTMLVKGLHDVDLVEAVFKQADKDNSGTIEAKELKRVLGHFGLMPTEPHVKAAIEGYDTLTKMKDGRIGRKDKKLDLPEFQRLVKDLLDGAARRKEALAEVMVRVEGEFVKADKNKSGTIDWKELKKVLASLGHDMGKTYCQKVVKKFDDDGSKTLDLDEFKSVVGHLMGAQEKYDDAKVEAEFTRADKNASGTIDAAELRGVLGKLGHDLGKKYVANVLKKYDDDGSKALSLKEFKAVIASILGAADDGEGEEDDGWRPDEALVTEALRDIIDGHLMPCVASIVEATEAVAAADGGAAAEAAEAEGEEGVAAPLPPPWGQTDDGVWAAVAKVREKLVETKLVGYAVPPAADDGEEGAPEPAPPTADEMVVPVAALAKSLAAAPTMLEGAMTAKEVTRILEAAQGEVLEARASPGRQAAARRGSLHLLDDRPADHGFFADVDECVWGVWAVLRRRFARDGVADPARAARCLEAWIATGKEAAPRAAPAAAAAPEPAAKKKGKK